MTDELCELNGIDFEPAVSEVEGAVVTAADQKMFFPSASQRADLIAAGWKRPMPPFPKTLRLRVEADQDGVVSVFHEGVPVHSQARCSAFVTLVDGVFENGWK